MYIINILCYLGFAPEISILKEKNSKISHSPHINNGLFLGFLFILSGVLFFVIQIVEWLSGVQQDSSKWGEAIVNTMDLASIVPFCISFFLFILGLLYSFFDGFFPIPSATKFLQKESLKKFIVVSSIITQISILFFIGITIRATKLATSNPNNASVYMLYHNVLYFGEYKYIAPEWVFPLGFYPIAEIATYRWGKGSVSVEPFSPESLKNALSNGRLIFVASHGDYGNIYFSDNTSIKNYIEPSDIAPSEIGKNLQFIYLAGCNAGNLQSLWEQTLYPAKVISFDRFTWVNEHVFWLWLIGPKITLSLQ